MGLAAKYILALGAGAAVGFVLHRIIGCASGACPIWSSPWLAMLYGAGVGALLVAHN